MAQAVQKQEDLDFEIRFYEGILANAENFSQALILLGELYTRRGLYEKGLEVDLKVTQLFPEDGVAFYNLACSYSLLNKIDLAFGAIKAAVHLGYNEFRHMAQDQDLANLFQDSRFQQYLSQLKAEKELGPQKES